MLAGELPRVPLRPQQPAAHYLSGRGVLSGPHLGTVGRGRGGGMATSGEPVGSGGWGSTRSTLWSRALASVGYWAEHAAFARVSPGGAETLQAGCNELRVALHLLRRPFDKFWLHLDNYRYAVKIDHNQPPKMGKHCFGAAALNLGCVAIARVRLSQQ